MRAFCSVSCVVLRSASCFVKLITPYISVASVSADMRSSDDAELRLLRGEYVELLPDVDALARAGMLGAKFGDAC